MAKMFYSLEEAAGRLSKTADEVRSMIESGELQEFRSGDELVVKREQIDLLVGDDGSDESVANEILGSEQSALGAAAPIDDNDESLGVIGLSDSVVDDDGPIVGTDADNDDSLVIGLEDSAMEPLTDDASVAGGSIGLSESQVDNISLDGGTTAGSSAGGGSGGNPDGVGSLTEQSGGASDIISLASESGSHAAMDFDVPDAKEQTGISIFDDSLEDGDDAAATIVTDATAPDMTTPDFDAGASGSGLLDLTREGDDTSLGVDLLDDGLGASNAGLAGAAEISEEGALFETPTEADTDIASASPVAAFQEPYDGGGSGLVGGLAFGVAVAMLFTGAMSVLWLMGGSGAQLFEQFGAIPWYGPVAGIAGITLLVTIIAWVLGRRG
ncbi:MAG: hypothetical protein AAFR96_03825 [Planctomycetota bacterium]